MVVGFLHLHCIRTGGCGQRFNCIRTGGCGQRFNCIRTGGCGQRFNCIRTVIPLNKGHLGDILFTSSLTQQQQPGVLYREVSFVQRVLGD